MNFLKLITFFLLINMVFNKRITRSSFTDDYSFNLNERNITNLVKKNSSNILSSLKKNNLKVFALVDKSLTLTCSIDLDDINFSKSENYKIIWSREIDNGRDYEPIAFDDTQLGTNPRISSNRQIIQKKNFDQIQWNLVINDLKLSDSNNYICQLNKKPYDTYWLKRFMVVIYEPAYFADDDFSTELKPVSKYENSIFLKNIHEFTDFKLKCNARGKPKPVVSWYLTYLNGTSLQLDVNNPEIIIKNIKKTSKIDKVECRISNGYGPIGTRSFKINIMHAPLVISKPKTHRVPLKTSELKLNCSVNSNPASTIYWQFKSNEKNEWKSINLIASYSLKYNQNENSTLYKLSLSKYQIFEKYTNSNLINSMLVIKSINEKDYGIYRCMAMNSIGNKTVDFKILENYSELDYHTKNSEKMRSLFKQNSKNNERSNKINLNKNELNSHEDKLYDYNELGFKFGISLSDSIYNIIKIRPFLIIYSILVIFNISF